MTDIERLMTAARGLPAHFVHRILSARAVGDYTGRWGKREALQYYLDSRAPSQELDAGLIKSLDREASVYREDTTAKKYAKAQKHQSSMDALARVAQAVSIAEATNLIELAEERELVLQGRIAELQRERNQLRQQVRDMHILRAHHHNQDPKRVKAQVDGGWPRSNVWIKASAALKQLDDHQG